MTTVEFIRTSLELSSSWILGLAEDAKDIAMTAPTPRGGNHPLWCVGHLVYSEADLIQEKARGGENPLADWEELFKAGSQPSDDPGIYPPMEEVLAKAKEVRAATLEWLATLSDADLDQPSHGSDEFREWFPTVGHCFAAIPTHEGFHGGQIADARRAAGRGPLMG